MSIDVVGCYFTEFDGPIDSIAEFVAALRNRRGRPRHRPGANLTSGPVGSRKLSSRRCGRPSPRARTNRRLGVRSARLSPRPLVTRTVAEPPQFLALGHVVAASLRRAKRSAARSSSRDSSVGETAVGSRPGPWLAADEARRGTARCPPGWNSGCRAVSGWSWCRHRRRTRSAVRART